MLYLSAITEIITYPSARRRDMVLVAGLLSCKVAWLLGAELPGAHIATQQLSNLSNLLLVLVDDFGVDHIILRIGGRRTGRLTCSRCRSRTARGACGGVLVHHLGEFVRRARQ